MFIHIGGAQIVFNSDLIGIFNYNILEYNVNRNLTDSLLTEIVPVKSSSDRPKSLVVTNGRVYTSPISPLTLSRRRNTSL